ncbi:MULTISPECIES: ABC transporter permease [Bacillus cereus group]|uniref:ABC transporter permease n=1 Tax=Bacillus cereus group TaxID=86661 RepID=UPI000B4B7201|nr:MULTISPECIES: ABC transporter permease [Bacillus cereus group]MDA1576833.1 ABC transporter permease [Bacillus cereus group sp. TH242-3LC]RRA94940.1 ABC transporter permease [Bacillus pacificus]
MATYEYSEDQRNYFRGLIAEWQKQNELKTTSESQRRSNLDRMRMLEYMIYLPKQQ